MKTCTKLTTLPSSYFMLDYTNDAVRARAAQVRSDDILGKPFAAAIDERRRLGPGIAIGGFDDHQIVIPRPGVGISCPARFTWRKRRAASG
jgi:hypothetical protein